MEFIILARMRCIIQMYTFYIYFCILYYSQVNVLQVAYNIASFLGHHSLGTSLPPSRKYISTSALADTSTESNGQLHTNHKWCTNDATSTNSDLQARLCLLFKCPLAKNSMKGKILCFTGSTERMGFKTSSNDSRLYTKHSAVKTY